MAKGKATVLGKDEPKAGQDSAPEQKAARLREGVPQSLESYIKESRARLKEPLEPGQAFFEAPDGFVTVGDKDERHVWYARGNKGKGMWINQRR